MKRHGFATPFVLVLAVMATAAPAHAAGKLQYGSRTGMTVTVTSMSGIGGKDARIAVRHTREDAVAFCRDYIGKVTETCIAEELATRLNDEIHGDCVTGKFVNFFGEGRRFLGKAKTRGEDMMATFAIQNLASGEIADGSSASGYDVDLGLYRALCPGAAVESRR